MKIKILCISLLLLTSTLFVNSQTSGTINFDVNANWTAGSGLLTSYETDHQYNQDDWTFTGGEALRQTTSLRDGFPGALGTYSWRLNSGPGTELRMISNSTGAVEEFGFSVRRWDNNPSPNFEIQYSTNGGASYTSTGDFITNTFVNNSSDWTTYQFIVPSPIETLPGQFIVRLQRVGISERIMVDDFTYTINTTSSNSFSSLRNPDCSRDLDYMSQNVYARIIGAEQYTFQVTNLTTGEQTLITKGTRDFNLTELDNPVYETDYEIRVQTVVAGVTQPIGSPCVITSPESISQLRTVDCGKQLISFAHPSYGNITAADQWEFEVTNYSTMNVETVVKQDRSFSLNDLSNPQMDVAYGVRVRVVVDGVQQPYDPSCDLLAPSSQQMMPLLVSDKEFEGLTTKEVSEFKESINNQYYLESERLSSYPNPFHSEGFQITLKGNVDLSEYAEVTITDLSGKIVYQDRGDLSYLFQERLGSDFTEGVYLVRLVQGSDIYLTKVVKK